MELSTARRLSELNRRFYSEHAENFGDARPSLPAGARRILAGIAPGARVLELGCGDGKVGRALAAAGVAAYVGLDASEAMLERARRLTTEPVSPAFRQADLTDPAWAGGLPREPFDWILAFAVFHHLPGRALRAAILKTLAEHLAPGGRVALSNWQFRRSERLMRRSVPWAQAGLDERDVEPGDHLLAWERKGAHGLRYVHLISEAELRQAAAETGLRVVEFFRSDGVSHDLADYAVLEAVVSSR